MGILIKNGLIIDGTGSSRYNSDILIEEDKIIKIGKELKAKNSEVIDASNHVVSPGFIDLHNHADLSILDANQAEAFVHQGLTTLLVSLCGIGLTPANEKVKKYYFEFVNKAFCSTPVLFDNLNKLFEALEKKGISINLAFLIPQGNVRACVLGTETRAATEAELNEMRKLVEENMKAGAFGLSTGLVYPPGSSSSTEELIELSKVVSKYDGIYNSHMRNEGAGVIDIGMNELIRIAKEANINAHISHWSAISKFKYEELTREAIKLVNQERSKGITISADITTYDDAYTNLSFILLPTWVYTNFKENLTNQTTRKRIIDEIFNKIFSIFFADAPFFLRLIPKFLLKKKIVPTLSKTVTIIHSLKNHQLEGRTLYDALTQLYPNDKLEDALLNYMRDEDGGIMIRQQTKNEEKSMIPFFSQEYVSPSTDAILILEGNTHPRTYGAFPRVLARWVREKKYLTLEEAIRKMTSLPASVLNIKDRGIIKEGYKADLVIFDPDTIQDKGTLKNGCQYPDGIAYVIINGEITIDKGKHIGTLNGNILRHVPKK